MKEIRVNMEEIVIQGTEYEQDTRMVNSYPSKVVPNSRPFRLLLHKAPVFLPHRIPLAQFRELRAPLKVVRDQILR